ncbi:ABC transporter substrate-binding protein [Natrinema salifodinae]|uniref:Peptide/nickel transport system substrate-binding protein n=1 Tax=Natrinema salifodinae TaxID=1202768 RepID=A0A1I0NB05_9EURY|nr:ABC transporter substrate-binding protein [Natrinema salifodinae]SEV97963.1 peptide/nickel transport system substrate-binding protein [Natrinema salifodinae]
MKGRRAAHNRCSRGDESSTVSRRAMLAATAGLTASTAGCLQQVRDILAPDNISQLSLTITTLPADSDRESTRLARELAEVLETVGIDVSIDIRSQVDFHQTVLYDHEFDVCVGHHPGGTDPDYLYEALHSIYDNESGWQNPFGYTDPTVDDYLEEQRRVGGDERHEVVANILDEIATQQPFVPICVPEEHRIVRTDRFGDWGKGHLATRRGYLGLEPSDGVDQLRATQIDARPTENLNPLAADYRDHGAFIDLLYDSLAIERDGEIEPWLADEWKWDDGTIDVHLREGCTFHDGEPVTAEDVAFTYRFLQDMSLDETEAPSPAPRYRGQTAIVETINPRGREHLELTVDTTETVAERALLVPIFPAHIWRDRGGDVMGPGSGASIAQGTTEAVVADNIPPVGSGPFQFEDRTQGDLLTFERFDTHFTRRPTVDLPEPTVDELSVRIDPSEEAAVQIVEDDTADVTSSPIDTGLVDEFEGTEDTMLLEDPSWTFYFLGFNVRKAPFNNFRFRRIIAQLLDKEWLTDTVFHGRARPIAAPVPEQWVPDPLTWDGSDPETPFLGSDGEVDESAARSAFEDAGFRYDDQGRLRVRQ